MAPTEEKRFCVAQSRDGHPADVRCSDTMEEAKGIGRGRKQEFACAIIITDRITKKEYSIDDKGELFEIE
jgi:hypothetical protein